MPTFWKHDQPSRYDRAKQKKQDAEATWKEVCEVVDARDKRICRACGKHSRLDACTLLERGHRHHIVYRSAGGQDVSSNLVTLCAFDHNEEHQHRLSIRGDADKVLEFWRRNEDGWYLDRKEKAPHVIDRD